jgi:hypothetical protein
VILIIPKTVFSPITGGEGWADDIIESRFF